MAKADNVRRVDEQGSILEEFILRFRISARSNEANIGSIAAGSLIPNSSFHGFSCHRAV